MSVRVLVVDDSAMMRALIAATLLKDPAIEIIGEAADPLEARTLIKQLDPDVLTLDVEMPAMHGLEFLERLMRLRPMPVVMVSGLTKAGADETMRALELGAVDVVGKPGLNDDGDFGSLAEKVKQAATCQFRRHPTAHAIPTGIVPAGLALKSRRVAPDAISGYACSDRIVAIGSSTGGVEALITLLSRFPKNCPATLITQHMPAMFTATFADRLDRLCAAHVTEAVDGAPVEPGRIYIAAGGMHLRIDGARRCRVAKGERVNGHQPSVNVLFTSIAEKIGARSVGVILTGMGDDGAAGLLAMRDADADTLGQDETSSLIYGMPRAAFELGAVAQQLPLARIADRILQLASASRMEKRR